ncbi:putative Hydrophobic surface binding protein A-domain-containing protein [Seiridium cardinale]|uniref:Hydrophobic surface binding protein A-domain-containing protein n=1 Tax=Seiridium cardinale TaxID=138064 RepID=A0ABR2Y4Y1_9PEZI
MKTSMILSSLGLATITVADSTLPYPPTKVERDVATVSSVVAQVSSAIAQLDTSVKAFSGDATQVQSDATSLVNAIGSGVTSISASTDLTLTDSVGLQSLVASLQTAGQTLVDDLSAKKTQFEQSSLCETVQSTISGISTSSKSLIDAVVAKVPEEAQSLAQSLASGLQTTLDKGATAFSSDNCINSGTSGGSTGTVVVSYATSPAAAVSVTGVATESVSVSAPEGGASAVT